MFKQRLLKELKAIQASLPIGITCWQTDDPSHLRATIVGLQGCPYEGQAYELDISIPLRYPLEPPLIKFITDIYHPNCNDGRICLDILKLPPKGKWNPTLTISSCLSCIQLLMSEPNPDDPLNLECSKLFKENYALYSKLAREHFKPIDLQADKIVESKSDETERDSSSKTLDIPDIPIDQSPSNENCRESNEITPIIEEKPRKKARKSLREALK